MWWGSYHIDWEWVGVQANMSFRWVCLWACVVWKLEMRAWLVLNSSLSAWLRFQSLEMVEWSVWARQLSLDASLISKAWDGESLKPALYPPTQLNSISTRSDSSKLGLRSRELDETWLGKSFEVCLFIPPSQSQLGLLTYVSKLITNLHLSPPLGRFVHRCGYQAPVNLFDLLSAKLRPCF